MAKKFLKPTLRVKKTTTFVSSNKSALCSGSSSHIVVDVDK